MPGIDLAAIRAASERIRPIAKRTPVLTSRGFNTAAGVESFFKCENFQTGGAFKIRGAANFVYSLTPEQQAKGVVAFSSGNHAQAVAIAAKSVGTKATLVMPLDSPKSKVEATRAQGGHIIPYDRFTQDRVALGRQIAEETGAALVPPFDHEWIMTGQGTSALELIEEVPDLDAIAVPIGGGGLISGCSIAAHGLNPNIRVIGVEPADGNDAYLSFEQKKRVQIPPPATIADGLRSPAPGDLTLPIMLQHLDRVVLVTDDEIRAAMKFLLLRLKIVVEPSGAVTAAAAMFGKLAGVKRVGLVLSGGNVDYEMLAGL
jgi:threonine dehydratase